MDKVKPSELLTAARVADALVYAAIVAGVVAGGALFLEGEAAFAVVAWILTLVAGAGLRLASWAAKGIAELMERAARMEEDLARLAARPRSDDPPRGEQQGPNDPPDPWKRLGGWH